jgi:two-component system KDP operon response regulator KdpE
VSQVVVAHRRARVRRLLGEALRSAGYEVVLASTAASARQSAIECSADALVVGLSLFDPADLAAAARLREELACVVLVIVAPERASRDLPAVLDLGVDDCLSEPVASGELVARLRATLRRRYPTVARPIHTLDFDIDVAARQILVHGVEIHLTPIEWRLVEVLVRNQGTLVHQTRLLAEIWGSGAVQKTHYLRVFMSAIRHKLEPDPSRPRYFVTEPRAGVRFVPEGRRTAPRERVIVEGCVP